MKVQGPSGLNPVRRSALVNVPRAVGGNKSTGERVEVSSLASMMASSKAPEVVDESRIERIKQAIENGSFQIDPEQIARRMLGEES